MKLKSSAILYALALLLTLIQTAEAGRLRRLFYSDYAGATVADLWGTNTLGVNAFPGTPSGADYLPPETSGPSSIIPPYLMDTGTSFNDNYGSWIRGYVTAPETGNYVFYLTSDDESLLFLTTDSADPLNPTKTNLVCHVPGWANIREWNKYPSQQSAPVALEAGKTYYVELFHKEGTGGDHIVLGWQLPSGIQEIPMPSWYFQPVRDTRWSEPDAEIVLGPVVPANFQDPTLYDGMRAVAYANVNLDQPVTYQWLKNGSAVSGETKPYYLFRAAAAESGAQIAVRVTSNGGAPITVPAVNLTVNADQNPPTVASAGTAPQDPTIIQVVFSKEVKDQAATNLANYTLPGATFQWAKLLPDNKTVQLKTALLAPDQAWNLTVRDITDWATPANTLTPNPTVITILPAEGGVTFRTYPSSVLGTQDLPGLRTWSSTNSTVASYTNSAFTTEQVITTASQGWNLVPLTDSYLGQWIGYVTAPETGDYRFGIASDDHSILYLGTNHLRSSKREIANYNGSTGRWNLGAQANQRSALIRLEAGKRYYIEAVYRDGTGGDGVTVAWKRPSDASDLPPANASVQADTEPFLINATNLTPYYVLGPLTVKTNLAATLSSAAGTRPTLRVAVDGYAPYNYRWFRNDTLVANATGASYQLPFLTAADNASTYFVVVSNNFSAVTSAVTTLTVTADTTAPTFASVGSLFKQVVDVRYSEPVSAASAGNVGAYSLFTSAGAQVAITSVTTDPADPTHFTLQTAAMPETDMMRLIANNVADAPAGNVAASLTNQFRANNFDQFVRVNNSQAWTATASGDQIRLTAGGSDIWGTSDQMVYLYKAVNGNFDYKALAPSALPAINQWVKMGLMARGSTNANARNAFIAWTPPTPAQNTYTPQIRDTTGGASTASADAGSPLNVSLQGGVAQRPNVVYPSWLRLQRINDTFYYYYSPNGTNWTLWTYYDSAVSGEGALPKNIVLGLALTSHDTARTADGLMQSFQSIPAEPLALVLQPTNTTVVEGQNANFFASVRGNSPYLFQWLKNGDPILDATNVNLVLPRVPFSDNAANIALRVTNPQGETQTSTNALLTIIKDTTAPSVRYLFAPKIAVVQGEVKLIYSEPMNRTAVETAGNYVITPAAGGAAIAVNSAILDADERTVTLSTANMTAGTTYKVVVNNVMDLACCPANNLPANSTDYFYFAGSSGKFTQRADGYVIMEAENHQRNTQATGAAWELQKDAAFPTFSGSGYMIIPTVGGTGGGATSTAGGTGQGTGSYLEFDIVFTRPATNYTIWLRGRSHTNQDAGNNDSVYLGLDGNLARLGPATAYDANYSQMTGFNTSWDWRSDASAGSDPMILTNIAPGQHTLIIYHREDGTMIDKVILEPGFRAGQNSTDPGAATSNGGLGDPETWDYQAQPPAPPTIAIVAPLNNQTFPGGANISLETTVTGPTPIQMVEFLNGTNILATVTSSPYNATWQNVPEGIYTITARVTDVLGYSVTSTGVRIVVDSTKPVAYAVGSKGENAIGVYFRDLSGLNAVTATTLANYVVNGGAAAVTNAVLEPDNRAVILWLAAPVTGQFNVQVSNVSDQGFGPNVMDAVTLQSTPLTALLTRDVGVTNASGVFTDPVLPGLSMPISTDGYYIRAGGHDIWDAADGMHFAYVPITGDFDVSARVESLTHADVWSKAGLMIREDLEGSGRNHLVATTPSTGQNLITMQWRPSKAAGSLSVADASRPRPSQLPNAWLRITRTNENYGFYWGTNGVNWTTYYTTNMTATPYPSTVYVGLGVTSHNNGTNMSNTTSAYFRDIKGLFAPAPAGTWLDVALNPAGTSLIISWTSSNASLKLQSSSTLAPGSWGQVNIAPIVDGNNYTVTVPIAGQSQFFRLTE